VFARAGGQQRAVVEVERVSATDLDARHVAVAGQEAVSAVWMTACAGERSRRVRRLARSGALLP